jgi:hypothetical protein
MGFGQIEQLVNLLIGGNLSEKLKDDPAAIATYLSALDAYARRALVYPAVVDRPEDVTDEDAHIFIDDLDDEDKQVLLNWNGGEEATRDAVAFRDGSGMQDQAVEPLPDGDGAGAAPEPIAGAAA